MAELINPAPAAPHRAIPFLPRLGLAAALAVAIAEVLRYFRQDEKMFHFPGVAQLLTALGDKLDTYEEVRGWVLDHPVLSSTALVTATVLALLGVRYALIFWHNNIMARVLGTRFRSEFEPFPTLNLKRFNIFHEFGRRPKDMYFVGMSPRRWLLGWRWKPVYISQRQRTMHRHVLGKTGSGKTQSVLWPQVAQDALDGKGILVMDAKGSDESVKTMKAIAALAKREKDLKLFALPAWKQPRLFSHTYNLVYVRPRNGDDPGGDPAATAERVFSILSLGDNEYYNTQAEGMFSNLCTLLHGMVDDSGRGLPFTLKDIGVCLKGVGDGGGRGLALKHCLAHSLEREAAGDIESQIARLGRDVHKAFSGLVGAIDKFSSPLVNAYEPDIVLEDVLQQNGIVYVQLPANLFKLQAPAMGKVMLMDVQQAGSLRQVDRTRNQHPFSVTVDEFYNFADLSFVDSLNKLRDANLQFTLAHQSIADLELVSKEFAAAVWDNCRTRDVLAQDNPELCEKIAKTIGTHLKEQKTVRMQQGALFTFLMTGDASSKPTEVFSLHPNRIKGLARCGQGFLYSDEGVQPVSYGTLPSTFEADYPLGAKDQRGARGLRLYERFVQQGGPLRSLRPVPGA